MKYKNTLLKLLHGISSDNAAEIDEACHTFLAITGIVSVEEAERKLAAHLTQRALDRACACGSSATFTNAGDPVVYCAWCKSPRQ